MGRPAHLAHRPLVKATPNLDCQFLRHRREAPAERVRLELLHRRSHRRNSGRSAKTIVTHWPEFQPEFQPTSRQVFPPAPPYASAQTGSSEPSPCESAKQSALKFRPSQTSFAGLLLLPAPPLQCAATHDRPLRSSRESIPHPPPSPAAVMPSRPA